MTYTFGIADIRIYKNVYILVNTFLNLQINFVFHW